MLRLAEALLCSVRSWLHQAVAVACTHLTRLITPRCKGSSWFERQWTKHSYVRGEQDPRLASWECSELAAAAVKMCETELHAVAG